MIFAMLPVTTFATESVNTNSSTVQWAGAMNFNDANNQVTSIQSMTASNMTEMKWAYPLNDTVIAGGAYYAGTSIIVDDYLYATGGGKLHKVNINTGEGVVINDNAGVTISYYDYLCYADGIIVVASGEKLEAFSMEGTSLGSVEGSYGYYHPVQYHDGHVICNGFIYKLERTDSSVTFTQVGSTAIGGDAFNWSSGAFVDDLFYVVAKTTVYAVDYKTNTVVDRFIFDEARTATNNIQAGLAYDKTTGRLYWGTYSYNNYIHSIKIANSEGENKGKFSADSYISADAGQKSVATPIVYNGRVYLATQQGRMCVHNADDLSKVYDYVTLGGGKVQGTPILSTAGGAVRIYAQCANGHLYMFTDNGDSGEAVKLAETANYTDVLYPYAGFEQYAMDDKGNIYCCNESGYLFCFGISKCEIPVITTDLSTDRVKYAIDAQAAPLSVEASISEGAGELTYQWQLSEDEKEWTDISGATTNSYTPSTKEAGSAYYRCIITNTKDGNTASATSSTAYILTKILSDNTTLNVMVSNSNSPTGGTRSEAELGEDGILYVKNRTTKVSNIWVGTIDEGTVTALNVIQGAGTNTPKQYKVSNSDTYTSRYYRSSYTLPIVAKATVTAEDGTTEKEYYIVVSSEKSGQYITSASITSESEYFNKDTGVSFTTSDQTAALKVNVDSTIGTGEIQTPQWTWTSSDVKVATVDENGVVKSVGGGEATITASYQNVSASVKVTNAADAHKTHTYADGACSICGTKEPSSVTAYFTMIGKGNEVAVSKDGTTKINKSEISVNDADFDGTVTLNDAFIKVHTDHSANGAVDFATQESTYGLYITKLWGEESSSVAYTVNNAFASSLETSLKKNDKITAYFYQDTQNWTDIYTYIEGQTTIVTNNTTKYTAKGLVSSGEVVPKGATVKVYNSSNEEVSAMATTVSSEGTFELNFEEAGDYTVKLNGTATYTGQVWDYESGSYVSKDFDTAPVVLSSIDIKVLPCVEKTVYVTISTKSGEFAVNKNGDDMWRFPIKASDDPANPDGNVTIMEVLIAAHEQYHPDGASAFSPESFITKLWGESNGGNCSYYFNDTYMTGSGSKTGSNGRQWQDELLNTVVEDGDSYSIYSFQSSDWSKGDLYTYFYPASESAVAGKVKTLTVKAGQMGSNKLETSLVKAYDSNGNELSDLATTVSADGTFSITFPKSGQYTVDVRTNGTNYVTPSRCLVYVSAGNSDSSSDDSTEEADNDVYISVKDPNGKTYLPKTAYAIEKDETAYSLLKRTGLKVQATTEHQFGGVYVEAIEGLGEFDEGKNSGWMYRVNGDFIDYSASLYELCEGDYVEWLYTRDLGDDVGGGRGSVKEENEEEKEIEADKSVTLTPSASADKNGYASAKVTDKEVTSIVKASSDDIDAIVVEPKIKGEATKISVEIPKAAVSSIAKNSDLDLTVATDIAEVTISNEGLSKVNGSLTFTAELKNDTVKVDVSVNGILQSQIDGGIIVTIPNGENSENAVLALVNEDGSETIIKKSVETKYGIKTVLDGSRTVKLIDNSKTYSDTKGHWGEDAISFVSSREIFSGTGKEFEPDSNMDRAMVVTTLFRLEDATAQGNHSFNDVPHNTWYTDAVIWANSNGIVNGTGNKFEPNANVTREQLCTMMMRYAKHIGMDTKSSASIDKFADNTEVSSWAKEAVVWATDSGIITGKPGNKLDPQGNATRAEVAVIYQRMINLMIK